MAQTSVNIKMQSLTLAPNKEHSMQAQTLETSRAQQENQLKDLGKFERLCCLGNDHSCERLGGKHHRTNTRCWMYPKVCYHCDLVLVRARETKSPSMTAVFTEQRKLQAASLIMSADDCLEHASTMNRYCLDMNRTLSPQISKTTKSERWFRASAISIDHLQADKEHCACAGDGPHDAASSGFLNELFPDTLVPSIEEDVPVVAVPAAVDEQDEMDVDQVFIRERLRRSQGPSPENSHACLDLPNNHSASVHAGSRFVQRAHGMLKRDPRYEIEFVMN